MADLTTKYLGLILRNPIIVGSSGLTDSVAGIKEIEKNGAGAVVLKSLFEEQIRLDVKKMLKDTEEDELTYSKYSETFDYIDHHIRQDSISNYIQLIKDAKQEILIPVIASINCFSATEWTSFAKKVEEAGADAIELNIFNLPSDLSLSHEANLKIYFEIIEKVLKEVKIPVSIKISWFFSNLGEFIQILSQTGVNGIVLFNRFFSPDIDIDKYEIIPANKYSSPDEITHSLRWIALMSDRIKCDLAASTGIHDGKGVIKQLLAGANAVQVVSTLYKNGLGQIQKMLTELEDWMEVNRYNYIDQFMGKMSHDRSKNPAVYERMQFMKYYSGIS
ncbi:MAG: dihydroorotate dehydrogenase-like protein [Bacteroidales bacterium]|nr:dihydroorotate dehydrogenase-like protein [Bacteroidales bacterium]